MQNKILRHKVEERIKFPEITGEVEIIDVGIVEGFQYLSCSPEVEFPQQDTLIEELDFKVHKEIFELIKENSMKVQFLNKEIQRNIRKKYSLEDELMCLRINNPTYKSDIEKIIEEVKLEKIRLGFYPEIQIEGGKE